MCDASVGRAACHAVAERRRVLALAARFEFIRGWILTAVRGLRSLLRLGVPGAFALRTEIVRPARDPVSTQSRKNGKASLPARTAHGLLHHRATANNAAVRVRRSARAGHNLINA